MTQPQANNEETALSLLPETYPAQVDRLQELLSMQEAEYKADPLYAFPSGASNRLFTKNLERVPFFITSEVVFRTEPAKTVQTEDKTTGEMRTYTFDAHLCAQCTVRRLNIEDGILDIPRMAKFDQMYLVNQFKSLVDDRASFLGGMTIWTIRRNPKEITKGGEHPFMLDKYVHSRDRDVPEPSVFDAELTSAYPGDVTKGAIDAAHSNPAEEYAQWLFGQLNSRSLDYANVATIAGVERSSVNAWKRPQWEQFLRLYDKQQKLAGVKKVADLKG